MLVESLSISSSSQTYLNLTKENFSDWWIQCKGLGISPMSAHLLGSGFNHPGNSCGYKINSGWQWNNTKIWCVTRVPDQLELIFLISYRLIFLEIHQKKSGGRTLKPSLKKKNKYLTPLGNGIQTFLMFCCWKRYVENF